MTANHSENPEQNAVFDRDCFAHHLGIELLEAGEGTASARMVLGEQHLNGMGTVHGGAIFGLADLAFAVACNSREALAVALNVNISYVKAVRGGVLYARATETSLSARIGTYEVVVTDEQGETVALFYGMAYRKQAR
ncbi:MAG: hotdog fold thioesterase [Chloroflexi bacterium]|nr:hotdog fold thioesterase [Chloroflexota bacterium]